MSHKNSGTTICPSGPVPGFKQILEDLGVAPDEFAFISGLSFWVIHKIQLGESIEAKDRERVLETVVVLKRQKRDACEAIEVRKAIR